MWGTGCRQAHVVSEYYYGQHDSMVGSFFGLKKICAWVSVYTHAHELASKKFLFMHGKKVCFVVGGAAVYQEESDVCAA